MLRFSLTFKDSRTSASFKRQLAMAGMDTSAIPDVPDLMFGLSTYFDAFFDLSTTRVNGMGVGMISYLSVQQYATIRNYDEFGTYFLHRVVRTLDPIYVEYMNNESKRNQKR